MSSLSTAREGNLIQSVVKALDVLDCLATSDSALSVRQIADQCGFSRPTTYRLLNTLQSRNFVQNTQDGSYHVGTRILSLGKSVLDRLDLADIARPYIHALSQKTEETVYLSILEGTEILYIAKAEGTRPVHMFCNIGTRNPVYNTSMGKAILAFLPQERRDALLQKLSFRARTRHTITDLPTLVEHLAVTRGRGFAIDNQEVEEGIRCVGAPVFDHTQQVVGAISVSGPAHRMTDERIDQFGAYVMDTAKTISSKLGFTTADTST